MNGNSGDNFTHCLFRMAATERAATERAATERAAFRRAVSPLTLFLAIEHELRQSIYAEWTLEQEYLELDADGPEALKSDFNQPPTPTPSGMSPHSYYVLAVEEVWQRLASYELAIEHGLPDANHAEWELTESDIEASAASDSHDTCADYTKSRSSECAGASKIARNSPTRILNSVCDDNEAALSTSHTPRCCRVIYCEFPGAELIR